MYNLGIIGTVIIVGPHVDALEKVNLFKVVAVCDAEKPMANIVEECDKMIKKTVM